VGEVPGGEVPVGEVPGGEVPGGEIIVSGVTDFAALEPRWRDLEARSASSFFQSWTWTGCLAEERFSDPVLVEAREAGRTVALALFNRRAGALHLGESGDPALDCVYIEYNGVLAEFGREAELTTRVLRAVRDGLRAAAGKPRLVLSGVRPVTAASAAEIGLIRRVRSLSAPLVDLTNNTNCFLDGRSANTRQQLRRSVRDYTKIGGIAIERAETLSRALEFLDDLAELHQASWMARGKTGAFANPFFGRFHRALIGRGMDLGEIDLLRVTAGSRTIGFLYNFRYRGHSLAYQSGFDYAGAGPHGKPGLTCHHEAIRYAAGQSLTRYDFLAGDDRYKRSLSDRAETLHWIEVGSRWSPRFLARLARDFVAAGGHRRGVSPPFAPAE